MKKFYSIFLVLFLILTIFTGCGKSNSNARNAGTANNASSNKLVTIKVLHYMGEQTKRDAFKAWTDAFTKTHPNVQFDVQSLPTQQYVSTLQTKIAAGDAPDIIFGKPKVFSELVSKGQILDLTGQSFLRNIDSASLSSMSIDGKVYAVPVDRMLLGVFYNKDMFKQNGLEVPKTLSDFYKVIETFEKKGITPFVRAFKDPNNPRVDFDSQFRTMVANSDKNFYSYIQSGKKKFRDYPMFKTALQNFDKRLSYKSGDDLGVDATQAVQLFASGKYPMYISGSWSVGEIRKNNPNGNFGFFTVPVSDNIAENLQAVGVDDAFMISSQTKAKDICLEFFKYITSQEAANIWADTAKALTIVKPNNSVKVDPMFTDMINIISSGKICSLDDYLYFTGEAYTKFSQDMQLFVTTRNKSEKDIDDFITKLDKDFESIAK